ncbi:putative F-box/FBD/LRR-repeat protein At4g13965 [Rutidosis leptorrhynchoides]|uniref:putative F-box/FBD/LRR-repeat protein At4g13965 n=1 Tax=Rutidosis leptorrhynchoides TaxID=125765 RepID=UPI003A99A5DF
MDSGCGHGNVFIMHVEDDRISSLPDDVIHKILSFVGLKHAVQASVLSSRWKYIWTSLPYLNFLGEDFSTERMFSKFVEHFITRHNNLLKVSSVKLTFYGPFNQVFVKRIMNYAFTHNAQQMTVRRLDWFTDDLPVSLFSSQSLKSLSLRQLKPAPTWDLPFLTTLYLDYVIFDVNEGISHISKCANLKNLTLHSCWVRESYYETVGCFDIHLPELCNLTLKDGGCFEMGLNVFAPQLENLTVIDWEQVHLQSIPTLVSLVFKGRYNGLLQISSFDLCFLEKVDRLCIYKSYNKKDKIDDDHNLVALLRQIQNAKRITLNLDLIQVCHYVNIDL